MKIAANLSALPTSRSRRSRDSACDVTVKRSIENRVQATFHLKSTEMTLANQISPFIEYFTKMASELVIDYR